MRNTQIKKLLQLQSMDMFTSYGHINRLINQNKITDFFYDFSLIVSLWKMYYTSNGITFELHNIFRI